MAPFIDYWTLFPQRHTEGSLSEVHPIELYKETYPTLGFTHKIKKRRRRLVRTGTNSWNTKITSTWLNDLYSLNQFKIELPWNNRQMAHSNLRFIVISNSCLWLLYWGSDTRVGILIVATIYLQLIQNRYMFRSFTVLQCSHQNCVQPVGSDVEVVGYL